MVREEECRELRRVDQDSGRYRKLILRGGRLGGAILLGDKELVAPIRQLIAKGVDVSAYVGRLLDDDFDPATITSSPPPPGVGREV